MIGDEKRIFEFLLTQASEHGDEPIPVSAITSALPDLSEDTIHFWLAIMESKRLFEDVNEGRTSFSPHLRIQATLSPTAWLRYGSALLGINVEEEIAAIADYIETKQSAFNEDATFAEIAAHLAIPRGRVWLAAKILARQNRIKVKNGSKAKWIGK